MGIVQFGLALILIGVAACGDARSNDVEVRFQSGNSDSTMAEEGAFVGVIPASSSKSASTASGREANLATSKSSEDGMFVCPDGFSLSASKQLCVNQTHAAGPFSKPMIAQCERWGGGKACHGSLWGKRMAEKTRGNGACPVGTILHPELKICADDQYVYGPFTRGEMKRCESTQNKNSCQQMRWKLSVLKKQPVFNGMQSVTNQKLLEFYTQRSNYSAVHQNVLSWYSPGRSNGCVAFMSTALRYIGVNVPRSGADAYINGENVSLVTKPFAQYLTTRLGWTRIHKHQEMLPGDVVFTTDHPSYPGYPAHTYMFQGWTNSAQVNGYVVDNQDFTHVRNIFGYGDYNFSPFQYALRAPH